MTHSAQPPAPTAVTSPIERGPGVVVPFAVPPREGVRKRRWTTIGIGAALFVLCCGGGSIGLGTILVTSTHQRLNDARAVVTKFMSDRQIRDYGAAYQLLCADRKDDTTPSEFVNDLGDDDVVEFVVGDPQVQANAVIVPVRTTYASGDITDDRYDVVVDSDGSSRVCGQE